MIYVCIVAFFRAFKTFDKKRVINLLVNQKPVGHRMQKLPDSVCCPNGHPKIH